MKNLVRLLMASSIIVPCAQAASVNGYDLEFYGFIKTSANFADSALGSFNNINQSAPTHAVAQTRGQDKSSRFSFQTQQTRFGTNLKKSNISGKLEFDFIDFSKSSPTTQMVPRVRIAVITYNIDADSRIQVGQDWDLFSPVNTFTYNYVGNYFLAGNTGFMRQQAQYHKKTGNWETGVAIGMAGNNPGVSDADLELGKSPTYALRLTRSLDDGRIGVSGIYASLDYETTNNSRRDSYGYNFFFEKKYSTFGVKAEAYYGQNLANIGALSLGKGTNATDVKEWGGSITAQIPLSETQGLFAGAGIAQVDNKAQLSPFALTANAISYPGIRSNFVSRAGYELKVSPELTWFTEVSRYQTDSKIADNKYEQEVAYGVESGLQLKF